jgi:putative transcriptional regulator
MRAFGASAILLLGCTVFFTGTAARQQQTRSSFAPTPRQGTALAVPKRAGNSRALAPEVFAPANRDPRDASSSEPQSQLIVASRNVPDPFFQKSVVLMLPFKEGPLLVGLIINKPSKIKVRDLFPNSPELQKLETMAYFGGPVDAEVGVRSAIFRSKTPPSKATLVFGDVYVSFDPDAIVALAENPQQASTLRIFVGRAQWAPEQFEGEVAAGAWYSLRDGPDSIFTTLPETLWQRLIEQVEPKSLVRSVPELLGPAAPLAVSSSSKKVWVNQEVRSRVL